MLRDPAVQPPGRAALQRPFDKLYVWFTATMEALMSAERTLTLRSLLLLLLLLLELRAPLPPPPPPPPADSGVNREQRPRRCCSVTKAVEMKKPAEQRAARLVESRWNIDMQLSRSRRCEQGQGWPLAGSLAAATAGCGHRHQNGAGVRCGKAAGQGAAQAAGCAPS